ncbi:MAG TPA: glycine--tRNA ligase subunit beta [Terracidiphilus sp.]|jgi:glycyl-tRNA synthetase beta chain
MSDFLLEIGLEEVPARMIAAAEAELGKRVSDLLKREQLLGDGAKVTTFSTPRRLAVLAEGVRAKQADNEKVVMGPSWKISFNDGTPTPAAEAFAKKAGIAVEELKKIETSKGEYVGATVKLIGRTASDVFVAELPKEVSGLYWAKNMYWRAGKPERFVRPVRWVVALIDAEVVPVEIAGIAAGNASRGHRVLHGLDPVEINAAKNYAEDLRKAFVVVDVAERRQAIRKALDAATRTVDGARWREDEALVETVTHLAEWPSVILGDFEREYLNLPEEVLVTVMRDHQKYFAVEDASGKLAPHFLAVLNTQTDEEGAAIIRHGNARVLRARFKDARFFWDMDQKTPLAQRMESLKNVTFQKELGSYYWKTEQNEKIAANLFDLLGKGSLTLTEANFNDLKFATHLAKTDLTTELVKEFTELQGVIGGLYARAQGLSEPIARAIYDQYTPASIDDPIPTTAEGQLLGIADRVQTIVAMFGIGNAPTGSKDPFGLRRAANAIVKILAESSLPLTLSDVVNASGADSSGKAQVSEFFRERLHFYLKDVRGFAYDVVNAALAVGADDVRDAIARAAALTSVRGSDDFTAVSAACKRIKNILKQAEEKGFRPDEQKIGKLAGKLPLEGIDLWDRSREVAPQVAKLREQRNYSEALVLIATLRPTIDQFFDKVMVLDADEAVRGANLGLIADVLRNFSTIADFSEIVTG